MEKTVTITLTVGELLALSGTLDDYVNDYEPGTEDIAVKRKIDAAVNEVCQASLLHTTAPTGFPEPNKHPRPAVPFSRQWESEKSNEN